MLLRRVYSRWDKTNHQKFSDFSHLLHYLFILHLHDINSAKVWELTKFKLRTNHIGHTGYINTVTVSPDGSLCASGGKDGIVMLWDLNDAKHLYSLDGGDVINSLVFSPNRYWLCAATEGCIKIWVF